jgi:hypothetical protein
MIDSFDEEEGQKRYDGRRLREQEMPGDSGLETLKITFGDEQERIRRKDHERMSRREMIRPGFEGAP